MPFPLQGFDPLPTQRGPPLVLFKKSILGRTTLQFFQKRLRRQYILILRGGGGGGCTRRKNAIFLVKVFQKVPKTPFLDYFFKILPAAQKNWPKQGINRARKINSVDLNFFLKIRPPRENT